MAYSNTESNLQRNCIQRNYDVTNVSHGLSYADLKTNTIIVARKRIQINCKRPNSLRLQGIIEKTNSRQPEVCKNMKLS